MQMESKRWMIGGAVAVVLVSAILVLKFARGADAATPDQAATAPRVSVSVAKPETMSNSFSVAGEFIPYQEVELHAKVAGYIKKINVDIGDQVKDGQVLAQLEVPELAAQVQGSEASVRHNQDEISRAQNEVARAEADHASLHAAAIRLKQASEARPGLIAAQELEDAQARDRASEAQVEVAKSSLSAARQQLDVSKADHLHYSALSDYTQIRAPFSGVVTWRYSDTGALVQSGTSSSSSQPVVKIAQVDVLRLRIPVPESVASFIHVGSPADIRVQATGTHIAGKVARLTDDFDRSTRAMQVEIDLPNKDRKLSPGMFADVKLQLENKPDALTVPVQALLRTGTKTQVMLVSNNDRVEVRDVKTGIESSDRVEIVAGLKNGDRVIVGNPAAYQEGESVQPIPAVETTSVSGKGGE